MGGAGPDGYPQGYGGYAMPVDTSIPPIRGARGRHSFPFPSPASAPNAPAAQQEIDTSKFVRRSEEDTRFRLLESRMHVDEDAMERMRETIRKVSGRPGPGAPATCFSHCTRLFRDAVSALALQARP
jgi:hypothetical protein